MILYTNSLRVHSKCIRKGHYSAQEIKTAAVIMC